MFAMNFRFRTLDVLIGPGSLMPELKDDLASLRIDRETPRPGRCGCRSSCCRARRRRAGGWYFARRIRVWRGGSGDGAATVESSSVAMPARHPDRVRLSGGEKAIVVSSKIQAASRNCAWKRSVVKKRCAGGAGQCRPLAAITKQS